MSETRTYTCLACDDRPVFRGKIGAAMHLRAAHSALLEEHHPDELLQEGPEFIKPRDIDGPYVCLYRHSNAQRPCGAERDDEELMIKHIEVSHPSVRGRTYGEHYVCKAEQDAPYDYLARPLTPSQLDEVGRFARHLETLRGAGDFLTECGA